MQAAPALTTRLREKSKVESYAWYSRIDIYLSALAYASKSNAGTVPCRCSRLISWKKKRMSACSSFDVTHCAGVAFQFTANAPAFKQHPQSNRLSRVPARMALTNTEALSIRARFCIHRTSILVSGQPRKKKPFHIVAGLLTLDCA